MAALPISMEKVKQFWNSQVHDDEKWAANMRLLRASGLFIGSIIIMRNFEDMFAV